MGHFGARPIRVAWYAIVFPALLLNYLGQGALLICELRRTRRHRRDRLPARRRAPFFALVPSMFLYPMVLIATVATVIASQALISGAFSLTQQAVQLGFVPRVADHPHLGDHRRTDLRPERERRAGVRLHRGRHRSPAARRSSPPRTASRSPGRWQSPRSSSTRSRAITGAGRALRAGSLVALFLTVDLAFFGANLAKLFHGGWFPMVAALGVFSVMTTWRMGARWRFRELAKVRIKFDDFFTSLKLQPPVRVKGTAVFMTQDAEGTPMALLHQLKHNQVLHEQVVLLTIITAQRADGSGRAARARSTQLARRVLARDRALRLHGDAERPRGHEARRRPGSGDLPRPHELLPRPRDVHRDRALEHAALAARPVHRSWRATPARRRSSSASPPTRSSSWARRSRV